MPLEKIGVRAVVENLSGYLNDARKVEGATKGMGDAAVKMSSGAKIAAAAQTALTAAVSYGIPALLAIGGATIKAIADTAAYAKGVRDLQRAIGATAEESSKLISAADDVGISIDSLRAGLLAAIRNGLDPTVEGLGRMADRYVSIQDPIARTKFLTDSFGRSGADLGPLMALGAEGIKRLGDEAETTGLVLSQEGVDSMRQYEIALDNTQDAVLGLKMALGLLAGPAATSFLEFLSRAAVGMQEFKPAAATLPAVLTAARTVVERMASLRAAASTKEILHTEALRRGTAELRQQVDFSRQIADYTRMQEVAEVNLAGAQRQFKQAQQEVLSVAQENMGIVESMTTKGSARQIADAKLIDQALGTNYAAEIERRKAEEQMWRDFHAKRITGEQVLQQLEGQKSTIMDPAIAAVKDAETEVARFQSAINALTGKTIYITQVCKGYMCPAGSKVGLSDLAGLNTGQGGGEQQATGGPLAPTAILGEHGWEAIINGMVIPHAMSVAMMAAGALQPKAKHAAGGFIDPASLAFPLTQMGGGQGSRVGIGQMNVSVSTDISRQAFLDSLRRAVQ